MTDRTFPTGARRDADNGKPRLDYLPWRALRSLGAYMRESGERFGACNYRRGMPLSELNASMLRHAADYQTAHSHDEAVRALHGVLFNASVALEQIILGRDDLDDMDVIRDGARPDAEFVAPRAPEWPDDEADVHSVHVAPREEWFCRCKILRPSWWSRCVVCSTNAPWTESTKENT